jgi:hypothetical protein
VNIFLADKDISNLESLDEQLLAILRLDQLREDFEAIRDEMVAELLESIDEVEPEQDDGMVEEGENKEKREKEYDSYQK